MTQQHILVIEDEEDILELITYNLLQAGYRVSGRTSGEAAFTYARSQHPDLILLDVMLPGIDGFQVCRELKQDRATRKIPVVIVTAKGEEADIVHGLETGADDYILKPFSPKVLIARISAVLRRESRSAPVEETVLTQGDLVIDHGRRQVSIQGKEVPLTSTEFKILYFLASKPGWVYSRAQIVTAIHETDFAVTARAIDVQIVSLRKKLGTKNKFIETVRGVGYRFTE